MSILSGVRLKLHAVCALSSCTRFLVTTKVIFNRWSHISKLIDSVIYLRSIHQMAQPRWLMQSLLLFSWLARSNIEQYLSLVRELPYTMVLVCSAVHRKCTAFLVFVCGGSVHAFHSVFLVVGQFFFLSVTLPLTFSWRSLSRILSDDQERQVREDVAQFLEVNVEVSTRIFGGAGLNCPALCAAKI
jgi:hypothetical protein